MIREAQEAVKAFHEKFGLTVGEWPEVRDENLRVELIHEEAIELIEALLRGDIVGVADGICDVIYVALGAAVSCGIDIAPLFAEVHRTNMLKEGGGTSAEGKILKPAGWQPPRIAEMLGLVGREQLLEGREEPDYTCTGDACAVCVA